MITVNGASLETPAGVNLDEFLLKEGFIKERIAVSLNQQVVRRADYPAVILKDGDIVDIFNFTQGG
jgi:thiamine biosynthesis protein ThiS